MSKSKKNEKKFNLEEFISKSKTDKKSYILSEAPEKKLNALRFFIVIFYSKYTEFNRLDYMESHLTF